MSIWALAFVALSVVVFMALESGVGPVLPSEAHEIHAGSSEDLVLQMREAFLSGHSVRVDYTQASERESKSVTYSCRALTDEERVRVLRDIRMLIDRQRVALATPARNGSTGTEQHMREASLRKHLALEEAAIPMIESGHAFVSPSLIWELRSDSQWYYWNIRLRTKLERNAVVYVPIPLNDAPRVAAELEQFESVREYVRTEEAFAWNSLDFAERRRLVDEAGAARRRHAEIEQELDALAADSATAERRRALQREAEQLIPVISRAPRQVDPTTLEFVRR